MKHKLKKPAQITLDNGKTMTIKAGTEIEVEDTVVEQWVPEIGEEYWTVDVYGDVGCFVSDNDRIDKSRLDFGNVFKTQEQAELHKLRLQAMAKRWLPEDGQDYWYYDPADKRAYRNTHYSIYYDNRSYWLGNIHRTEQEAEEWGKKYGHAFALPEGE